MSIVLVTYKSMRFIAECMRSICQAAREFSYEIILVDNASGDGLPDFVRREFPDVTVLENKENEGFARAVNRGASMATGRYLVILNPDARLDPGTLTTLLGFIEKEPDSVVGPRAVDETGQSLPACRSLPHVGNMLKYPVSLVLRGRKLNQPRRFLLDLWIQDKTIDVAPYNGYIMGTCLVTSLDFFKKMGMFDQRYFLYCEDADLGFRILKGGYRAFLVSEASMIHLSGRSADQNPLSFSYFISAYLRYIHKNLSRFHGGVYQICLFLYAFIKTLKGSREREQIHGVGLWKSLGCFIPWKTGNRTEPFGGTVKERQGSGPDASVEHEIRMLDP